MRTSTAAKTSEFAIDAFQAIDAYAREKGVARLASCRDEPSVDFTEEFECTVRDSARNVGLSTMIAPAALAPFSQRAMSLSNGNYRERSSGGGRPLGMAWFAPDIRPIDGTVSCVKRMCDS